MRFVKKYLITALIAMSVINVHSQEKPLPYKDDPAILKKIKNLGDREALRLPNPVNMENGKKIEDKYNKGPYSRDYTNKMV